MKQFCPFPVMMILALICVSCSTPQPSSRSTISVDEEPLGGGVGSGEIRTMAVNMTPELLALPEIQQNSGITRIALSPMKNSSRFIIDMDIFMKRLRLELNKYSRGKIRFFSQGNAQVVRTRVLEERNESRMEEVIDQLASDLLEAPAIANAANHPTIAVIPVLNCNLLNMNADSLAAMLRSRIASQAAGTVQFLMPGEVEGADYFLTGQFIAEDIMRQGMVDLTDYIEIVEDRLRKGESLNVYDDMDKGTLTANQSVVIDASGRGRDAVLERIIANSRLQAKPNVTKKLNVMLVDPESKLSVFEKMLVVEERVTEGLGKANYVLAGEISGLSKRVQGKQTDYLLITFQLVDPDTNELLWESGEEVKKQSRAGIVYQ